MAVLTLETAASQIVQACDGFDAGTKRPFVFVVGAGLSFPSVPLSQGIIEHCQAVAAKYKRSAKPGVDAPLDAYSHWFEQAYPNARQRQAYLRSLIEAKPISAANLRLAHLLLDKRIGTVVVTPNFDDFISRALLLFGRRHIVCDHPGTVERIDAEEEDIQIVHVHGSYWFYDCCNLRGEIEARAQGSTRQTMASLLDDVFSRRSALVIGYGGWEGDAIMQALRRRLERPLPYNLYWFCYRHSEIRDLPTWLTSNAQVHFVAPTEQSDVPRPDAPASIERAREGGAAGEAIRGQTLTAQRVIERLIQDMELQAPDLTRDPLTFLARELRSSLTYSADGGPDVYGINEVIARIERAAVAEREAGAVGIAAAARAPESTESQEAAGQVSMEQLRDALRRSQYREVVTIGASIPADALTPEQQSELMDAMWLAAIGLLDNSTEELAAYDRVVSIGKDLIAHGPVETGVRERVAMALLYKGITLSSTGLGEEALAAYDEVVRQFADATEPVLREQVAKALVNRGARFGVLERHEEAIAAYDEVLRRFADATEPALREQVAKALFNKGARLGDLGHSERAVAVYDEVVRRFGDASEPALREQVAMALYNKGVDISLMGRSEEAVAAYDEVVRHFADATEPVFRELVAMALVNKGVRLGDLGQSEKAIAAYDEVVRRFGDATEPALLDQVAMAFANKGIDLGAQKRLEEAAAAYAEIVRRFGDSTEPALRKQVARALVSKGVRLDELGRSEEAIATCDEVVRRFGDAPDPALREQVGTALYNKGVRLSVSELSDEAIAAYDEVVRRFADATEPVLRELVAMALVNKGFRLGVQQRFEDAVTVYDEVVRRFGDATEPVLREQVAKALVNKGADLVSLGRTDDGVAAYDEVARRFGDAPEPVLREQVAMALVNKGGGLGVAGRSADAAAAYDEVVRRFGDAPEPGIQDLVTEARAAMSST